MSRYSYIMHAASPSQARRMPLRAGYRARTTSSSKNFYVYDDNGNLIEDPKYHYRWDFKNRLREVWTNESTPQLVAEYWYDSDNRRTKKAVDDVPTVYFLDAWNEPCRSVASARQAAKPPDRPVRQHRAGVQESDCFGVPLQQYVYGVGVDELIVMDRPVVDVATVQETCAVFSGGGTSDFEPAGVTPVELDRL